jgi:hypothetical protein
MANKLERTDYSTQGFVTATSRYTDSEVVYYGDMKLLTFATYKRHVYTQTADDMYSVVPAGWEYRPDQASMSVYGTPDFWWKIMEANNIKDVYDFRAGLNIRIPSNPY